MRITLPTGTAAEVARPASGEAKRGVVLWVDVFGLRPVFDAHAQRLADEHGWVVVAPEMYPGNDSMPVPERLEFAGSLNDVDKLADAEAAADVTGFDRVNVLGFCMGGMYAMKSLASPRFDRAAAFYGMVRLPKTWQGNGQQHAIDTVNARREAGDLNLLCIFGTEDPWCPTADIDEVEAAGATVVRYPGADHGWAQDPERDNYRAEDAADAWRRAEAFLNEG